MLVLTLVQATMSKMMSPVKKSRIPNCTFVCTITFEKYLVRNFWTKLSRM